MRAVVLAIKLTMACRLTSGLPRQFWVMNLYRRFSILLHILKRRLELSFTRKKGSPIRRLLPRQTERQHGIDGWPNRLLVAMSAGFFGMERMVGGCTKRPLFEARYGRLEGRGRRTFAEIHRPTRMIGDCPSLEVTTKERAICEQPPGTGRILRPIPPKFGNIDRQGILARHATLSDGGWDGWASDFRAQRGVKGPFFRGIVLPEGVNAAKLMKRKLVRLKLVVKEVVLQREYLLLAAASKM